jgi:glycopeptide antibiotics resistance protein
VLWPSGVDGGLQSQLWSLLQSIGIEWLTVDFVQTVANVLLFVPLGLLVALLLPLRLMWVVAAGGLALSVAIELAQAAFLPVRHGAELPDIIANTAGSLIGLGIALLARRRSSKVAVVGRGPQEPAN